jgi:hypothetical protein
MLKVHDLVIEGTNENAQKSLLRKHDCVSLTKSQIAFCLPNQPDFTLKEPHAKLQIYLRYKVIIPLLGSGIRTRER